ncbi:replication protein P [Pseudomonas oryzihabitans]|uniref:replication protein P n=1 Tax=Pseudomonas oryzihabitans TaxID=47885 RepID=UPI0028A29EA3|nr:replication protein P [Pseudomonas oryzihabitans]
MDELIRGAHATLSTSCTTTTGEPQPENLIDLDAQARRAVKRVFATLKTSYPAWYEKHYGHPDAERLAKRVWMTGVKTLTDEQVDRGLQRMVLDSDFPPSLKEFVRLCCKVDGLPTAADAWHQALAADYRFEAVKVAAKLTGTYELRRAGHGDVPLKAVFERNYAIVLRRMENGEPLGGKVPMALCHDGSKSPLDAANDDAERQLQERMRAQGIPNDPKQARAMLLAKMGIRRDNHA